VTTIPSITSKPGSVGAFFTLALGISWAIWVPAALASHSLLPLQINPTLSSLLGVFGPFLAALITASFYDGKRGFIALFRPLLIWRVGIQWYLFVLFWPAVVALTKIAIAVSLGNPAPDFSRPPFIRLYPLPPELSNINPFLFLPVVFLQQTKQPLTRSPVSYFHCNHWIISSFGGASCADRLRACFKSSIKLVEQASDGSLQCE
jgi:hypothetical protein